MHSVCELLQTWPSCSDFPQTSAGAFTSLPFTSPNTNAAIPIQTFNHSHAFAGLELQKLESLLKELFKEEGGFSIDEKDLKKKKKARQDNKGIKMARQIIKCIKNAKGVL